MTSCGFELEFNIDVTISQSIQQNTRINHHETGDNLISSKRSRRSDGALGERSFDSIEQENSFSDGELNEALKKEGYFLIITSEIYGHLWDFSVENDFDVDQNRKKLEVRSSFPPPNLEPEQFYQSLLLLDFVLKDINKKPIKQSIELGNWDGLGNCTLQVNHGLNIKLEIRPTMQGGKILYNILECWPQVTFGSQSPRTVAKIFNFFNPLENYNNTLENSFTKSFSIKPFTQESFCCFKEIFYKQMYRNPPMEDLIDYWSVFEYLRFCIMCSNRNVTQAQWTRDGLKATQMMMNRLSFYPDMIKPNLFTRQDIIKYLTETTSIQDIKKTCFEKRISVDQNQSHIDYGDPRYIAVQNLECFFSCIDVFVNSLNNYERLKLIYFGSCEDKFKIPDFYEEHIKKFDLMSPPIYSSLQNPMGYFATNRAMKPGYDKVNGDKREHTAGIKMLIEYRALFPYLRKKLKTKSLSFTFDEAFMSALGDIYFHSFKDWPKTSLFSNAS